MYLVDEHNHKAGATEIASDHGHNARANPTDMLALNWLEGHKRIMGFWLERLVSENGDAALIDTLHRQSQWLGQMTSRIGKVGE